MLRSGKRFHSDVTNCGAGASKDATAIEFIPVEPSVSSSETHGTKRMRTSSTGASHVQRVGTTRPEPIIIAMGGPYSEIWYPPN